MSVKSDTNKKWTSSDKYRDNFDNIFKKEEVLPDQDCWEDVIMSDVYDSLSTVDFDKDPLHIHNSQGTFANYNKDTGKPFDYSGTVLTPQMIDDAVEKMTGWSLKHKERLKCNLEIIEILKDFATRNPELRFGQMLVNLQVIEDTVDFFYEESDVTLNRIKDKYYRFLQADKGVF